MRTTIVLAALLSGQAVAGTRPFWTEKSSYIEDEHLYVVGAASSVKTEEEGRKKAFENGKIEVQNFAQVSDLSGLEIETQMTFSETNSNGTFNVFRLMRVDHGALLRKKEAGTKKAEANYRKFEESKTAELEVKRGAVARLEKIQTEMRGLDEKYAARLEQIERQSSLAVNRVRSGMTKEDVLSFVGQARSDQYGNLNYGKVWVIFESGVAQCLVESDYYQSVRDCSGYRLYQHAMELK